MRGDKYMNISDLERYTGNIKTRFEHMFFNYHQIEDKKRKREMYFEILSFVKASLGSELDKNIKGMDGG